MTTMTMIMMNTNITIITKNMSTNTSMDITTIIITTMMKAKRKSTASAPSCITAVLR